MADAPATAAEERISVSQALGTLDYCATHLDMAARTEHDHRRYDLSANYERAAGRLRIAGREIQRHFNEELRADAIEEAHRDIWRDAHGIDANGDNGDPT